MLCQVVRCVNAIRTLDTKQGRTRPPQPPHPHQRHRMLGMARQPNHQRLRQMATRTRPPRTSRPQNRIRALQERKNPRRLPTRPSMPQQNLLQPRTPRTRHSQRKHPETRPLGTTQNTLPQRTRIQRRKHTPHTQRETSLPRLRPRTKTLMRLLPHAARADRGNPPTAWGAGGRGAERGRQFAL